MFIIDWTKGTQLLILKHEQSFLNEIAGLVLQFRWLQFTFEWHCISFDMQRVLQNAVIWIWDQIHLQAIALHKPDHVQCQANAQ